MNLKSCLCIKHSNVVWRLTLAIFRVSVRNASKGPRGVSEMSLKNTGQSCMRRGYGVSKVNGAGLEQEVFL